MTHQQKGGKPQTHAGRVLKDPLPGPTESPFVAEPVKLVRRHTPTRWEYQTIQMIHVDLSRIINEAGDQGWEAVTYIPGAGILMKRPLPDAGA